MLLEEISNWRGFRNRARGSLRTGSSLVGTVYFCFISSVGACVRLGVAGTKGRGGIEEAMVPVRSIRIRTLWYKGAAKCGGREGGGHGPGGRSTWGTTRKRITRSVRPLAVAAERAKRRKLGRVRIFTDAQAAIARMTHDELGPSQTYAIQARQAIAALAGRNLLSRLRYAGARPTRGSPGTRSRTSGPSWPPITGRPRG